MTSYISLRDKEKALVSLLRSSGGLVVAFSGGVDSGLLCSLAREALGDHAAAITMVSPMLPESERKSAVDLAALVGIRHLLVEDNTIEDQVAANPEDRCYHCKKIEFGAILAEAARLGFSWVVEGSNLDDLGDYRPGLKATGELGVKSPLREVGLTKAEIRELARLRGLPIWDKPAYACLASRIPYGETITVEKLKKVELAEEILRQRGLRQYRVRCHGDIARIEVAPEERKAFFDETFLDQVDREFKALGFLYVSLELSGYRTGNLNRAIKGHAVKIGSIITSTGGRE